MIKSNGNIALVKRNIANLLDGRVEVTQNLGRNKFVSYCGIISGVYPSLFTVSPDLPRYLGKTSFSYSELMCGNVKIKKLTPSTT